MRHVSFLLALALVVAACGDSAGGADPDRFCALAAELDAQDTTGLPPGEALPLIKEGRAKFVEISKVAPAEIKDDVETVVAVSLRLTDVLIDAGGDGSKVDQGVIEEIFSESFTEEFNTAGEAVDDWTTANCP